jgi:hypothetical protein
MQMMFFFLASSEKDHIIKWDMFQLHQLESMNGILTRLFKQECQMIVMRYESYRYLKILSLNLYFSISHFVWKMTKNLENQNKLSLYFEGKLFMTIDRGK